MRSLILIVVVVAAVFAMSRQGATVNQECATVIHADAPPMSPTPIVAAPVVPAPQLVAQIVPPAVVKRTSSRAVRAAKNTAKQRQEDSKIVWRTTIDGPARKTAEEAWEAALAKAAETVKVHFDLRQFINLEDIATKLVVSDDAKTIEAGEPVGDLQSFSLSLEMPADYARELARTERELSVSGRMIVLSKMIAILVAGLFAVAGYVRLDDWSKGYMSGVLKAVAVVAVIGTGIVVMKLK